MEINDGQLVNQVAYRLSLPSGNVITKVNESISPVFQINEKPVLKYASYTSTTNDLTIQVPADKNYKIKAIRVYYTSNATVGNRSIGMWLYPNQSIYIFSELAANVQAASVTRSYYYADVGQLITGVGQEVMLLPKDFVVMGGGKIYFHDNANVDVGDTIVVYMQYEEESANA
jgi:hypothetical protein